MSYFALPADVDYFLLHLRALSLEIRAVVRNSLNRESSSSLATVVDERGGDSIFRLDAYTEPVLFSFCEDWGKEYPFLLVAEGISDGWQMFPAGASLQDAQWTLIVDPVDGTRGLMYGKRSAWTLTGIAPRPIHGVMPGLKDIVIAMQSELPISRSIYADLLYAVKGQGAHLETHHLVTGEIVAGVLRPSQETTLIGGFASIVKYLPGSKTSASALEEDLIRTLYGDLPLPIFDDEYISSGGQLSEMMMGRDRFIADLRPILQGYVPLNERLCAHPYDLCTALIAQECGIIITDHTGGTLNSQLDTSTPVDWIAYANSALHDSIAPVLEKMISRYAL